MSEAPEEDVVVGGGPREGEEVKSDHLDPEGVHPDFKQTIPGAPAPATEEPLDSGEETEEGSDEN